jgi:HD-GYP domain-containing protein (c-di-GMP phosphodiesterase class II)
VAASVDPLLVPSVPEPASPLAIAVLVFGLACFGLLEVRTLRTYLLTRRVRELLVAVGIAWLMTSLGAALLLGYMDLGWWLGHGIEVLGIFLVAVPVALDLLRGGHSRPLLGDLRAAELVASAESLLGSRVRALTMALADKDTYTLEHTRRVAMRAVQVGEELALPVGRLRAMAIGGLLHDIGKLSVPDEILRKPGPLDPDERAVMQRHTTIGAGLLSGSRSSLLQLAETIARTHHERWDGTGYPAGLSGEDIPLAGRICALCDVFDALVSKRPYKPAWRVAAALDEIRRGSGTQFDPHLTRLFLELDLDADPVPFEVRQIADSVAGAPAPSRGNAPAHVAGGLSR